MKKLFILLILLPIACLFSESLEIHNLGIGQGDCTLIIAKHDNNSYTTFLIDAGNSSGKGKAIFAHMQKVLGQRYKKLDYMIVSHLHNDHYGGMAEIMESMNIQGWKIGTVISKKEKTHGFASVMVHDHACTTDHNDPFFENDPASGGFNALGSPLDDFFKEAKLHKWNDISVGTELFRRARKKTRMKMLCVASKVKVLKSYGSKSYINLESGAHSENDYSYGFILEFDSFKYFAGGDLGGFSPAYLDLETPIINYLKTWPVKGFHTCVAKINHHGSRHSTNSAFTSFLRPTVSVIQSALRSFSGTQIPQKETIDALEAVNSNILYTYLPDANSTYWGGKVVNYNDVILKISKNPGYGKSIRMEVTSQLREKTGSLSHVGDKKTRVITCTKGHHAATQNFSTFGTGNTNLKSVPGALVRINYTRNAGQPAFSNFTFTSHIANGTATISYKVTSDSGQTATGSVEVVGTASENVPVFPGPNTIEVTYVGGNGGVNLKWTRE